MRKIILLSAILIAGNAGATAFGLTKAMTLEQLKEQGVLDVAKTKHIYTTTKLKNGHDDFNYYSLLVTPNNGLCSITAWTKPIKTNVYGEQIQAKFVEIENALIQKYGQQTLKKDGLKQGSIWNEQKDWMISMEKKERDYSAYWSFEKAQHNIQTILMSVSIWSRSEASVGVIYGFDNIDACRKEISDDKNKNL
jgi:hypothetical protein